MARLKVKGLMKIFLLTALVTLSPATFANKLHVYAAASMTNAVDALTMEFKQNSHYDVSTVYGGSSSIARQVSLGAPADIFISANTHWVDYLVETGVVSEDRIVDIARNHLVLVTNKSHQITDNFDITSQQEWLDILGDGRLAVGTVTSVPVGIYSKQSLESLGVWPVVRSKLAPVSNVRQVLALVERNEVPLGVVYQTDAIASHQVKVVAEFPDNSHEPIVYPMVALNREPHSEAFSAFVQSNKGQEILKHFGFVVGKSVQ